MACVTYTTLLFLLGFLPRGFAGSVVDAQKKLDRAHYEYQRGVRLLPPTAKPEDKKKLYSETVIKARAEKGRASAKKIQETRRAVISALPKEAQSESTAAPSSLSSVKKSLPPPPAPAREKLKLDGSGIPKTVTF
jgi:hypothetical protein